MMKNSADEMRAPGKTAYLHNFANDPGLDYAHRIMEENQERLEKIFSSVPVGILVIEAESHRIIDANPKALEMIGSHREKILGHICHNFICPAKEGECPITDKDHALDGSERSLLTIKGENLPILKTVSTIGIGGKKHLIESFLDISDLKATKLKLEESEKRYRDLFENVSDMVQMISPDGRILYSNPAWESHLGYDNREIASLHITDIIEQACREKFMATVARLSARQKPGLVETVFTAKDGRKIPVEGNISFQKEDDKLTGIHLIWRDITVRKAEEAQIVNLNRQLESMVSEKDRQLQDAQIKLIRAEKMATITGMAHGTAHELNNPVSGILCAVQVLRESKQLLLNDRETIQAAQWLEAIEKAATRCVKIVDDLNVFCDQEKTVFLKTDIGHILNRALHALEPEIEAKSIRITMPPPPQLPRIDADPWQLERLLTNVLRNAILAVDKSTGEIRIASSVIKDIGSDDPMVRLSIGDNGCGIPTENLCRIFDPFFTSWSSGKRTGLGLTVCYGIARRHHGDIDVYSSEKGTEVVVTLPISHPGRETSV